MEQETFCERLVLVGKFLQDNCDPYQSFNTETVIPWQASILCRQPTYACQTAETWKRHVMLWMGITAGERQEIATFLHIHPLNRKISLFP